jgi:hypothetical protein
MQVTTAVNGLEALQQLQATSLGGAPGAPPAPDIALVDLQMPVMGGLEMTRRFRQWCGTRCCVRCCIQSHTRVPHLLVLPCRRCCAWRPGSARRSRLVRGACPSSRCQRTCWMSTSRSASKCARLCAASCSRAMLLLTSS